MIKVAKESGADLVKFQLFDAEDDKGKFHYDWVKAHELSFDHAKLLFDYGQEIGIEVFFSVFDVKRVKWCEEMGVRRYKVASTFQRNPLELDAVIATKKPIILSLPNENAPNITIKQLNTMAGHTDWLFCPQGYPPRHFEMERFSEDYCAFQGFSDHTIGINVAKIALARGAQIIEKHFCLEHNSLYPDDAWSMTPDELRELVSWEGICQEIL